VFERFTERARQVVVLAQEEARELHHDYIGTEHILLGLLREDEGVAADVLRSLDVTLERTRAQVLRIVGQGQAGNPGQIPFTPRAKKVLELALREALSLDHNYIGTEHLLLAVVRENEGVAARILLDLDADPVKVRNEVIRVLSGPRGRILGRGQRFGPAGRASAELRREEPPPADDAGAVFASIERQIRGLLHREPDNGDLLVILATLPEGVVGRAFADLGITDEALGAALTRARAAAPDSIDDQIELARKRKDEALDAGDSEAAALQRDEERRLERERDTDLLGRVGARLGLRGGWTAYAPLEPEGTDAPDPPPPPDPPSDPPPDLP
jgi:Clp amino terminal domain, pathogenicity island component